MKVTINGNESEIKDKATVEGLLKELGLKPAVTVAEINGVILNRKEFGSVTVKKGDRIELVRFVGGG